MKSRTLPFSTNYLSNHQTSIIPIEVLKNNLEEFMSHPIGTGPFKVVKHDDTMLSLEANDAYFLDRPYLDRVEVITLPELYPNQNEMINYWFNLGNHAQEENWEQILRVEEGASYFTFNLFKQGIHQNTQFRKTLYQALDINNIGNELDPNYFFPSFSFLADKSKEYKHLKYGEEESRKSLHLLGYTGETLNIFATELRPGANHKEEALWLQNQWKKIGVKSDVKIIPIENLAKQEILNRADIVVAGSALGSNSLLSLLKTYQIPTGFILNTVGPDFCNLINEKLKILKVQCDRDNQLRIMLDLEHLLQNEFV